MLHKQLHKQNILLVHANTWYFVNYVRLCFQFIAAIMNPGKILVLGTKADHLSAMATPLGLWIRRIALYTHVYQCLRIFGLDSKNHKMELSFVHSIKRLRNCSVLMSLVMRMIMNLTVRASLIKPNCNKVMPCELKSYDEYKIECRHSNA